MLLRERSSFSSADRGARLSMTLMPVCPHMCCGAWHLSLRSARNSKSLTVSRKIKHFQSWVGHADIVNQRCWDVVEQQLLFPSLLGDGSLLHEADEIGMGDVVTCIENCQPTLLHQMDQ